MNSTRSAHSGFSLIELLVVMVIVTILAIVGVQMVGNRSAGSLRTVLDELEGVIASAHQRAVATGQDVIITTSGDWDVPNFLRMTYTGATPAESFELAHRTTGGVATTILREHMHAGVVTVANAGWWAAARPGSTDINTVAPFSDVASGFSGILADNTLNLFKGGATTGTVRISGSNKRFTTAFWIEVVGIRDGVPIAGGPMGLLVVQPNGASIYKFYNPGIANGGDGTWRRI